MCGLLKKYKRALPLFLILGFFAPAVQPAHAGFFDDYFNFTSAAMSGLADMGGWVFAVFTFLFVVLGISGAVVSLAGSLLEWSMGLPIQLQGNPVVEAGWQFTLNLANLFIVLIFLGIALSYIFRIETYGMKKALPRLIVIAILINFSLLFVGMFADVSTVFQNTILEKAGSGSGQGLISGSITNTIATSQSYVNRLIVLGAASAGLLAIPGVDVVTMSARIILFLAFIPQLVNAFFLSFFNIILSIIYFVYFALFMGRIIVFWILGIISPLAFLAFILPGTEKYFKQWLHALISWAFLGVIVLFLLVVGLQLIVGLVAEWLNISPTDGGFNPVKEYANLGPFVALYSILSVYLIFVLFAAKKLAPKGTEAVWSTVTKATAAAGIVGGIAAVGGIKKIATGGIVRPRGRYQLLRESGMGRRQAFTETMRRSLLGARQQVWPKERMGAGERISRIAGATGVTGTLKAIGDMAKAGALAGLGIKMGKKGLRKKPCEVCGFGSGLGEKIAASADKCPKCSHVFT